MPKRNSIYDPHGICRGCGENKKLSRWGRCEPCADKYDKELNEQGRIQNAMWNTGEEPATNSNGGFYDGW